jgi:hypothetical protein
LSRKQPAPRRAPRPGRAKATGHHSTIPKAHPPHRAPIPHPPRSHERPPPRVAHILDNSEASLLDVLDNLLNRGVMLNADIVLALADVDLIYLRLSALLCAADRVLPDDGRR